MIWVNYDDIVGQLIDAGFQQPRGGWDEAIDSGKKGGVRCKVEGSRQGGAISLNTIRLDDGRDALIGAGWYYLANEKHVVKLVLRIDAKPAKLSDDQRAAIKARQAEIARLAEAERAREIERASQKASAWWRKLDDAGQSGYMSKKGFDAAELFGARISPSGNLAIPVQDTTGKIYGLQVIFPTKEKNGRDKDFTPAGLGKKGHFYQIGLVQRGGVVLLCEGFATGASLRKATGLPVVVAFDAGNLTSVAQAIYKTHRKDVKILVCADDDYLTEAKTGKNPGRDSAATAAMAVAGCVAWPKFPDERPMDRKGPTDFNDLHVHPGGGLPAVRTQIEEALTAAGWRAPKRPTSAASGTQGGGESGSRARSIMWLDELVERFVPLDDGTGKYVFDLWTNKVALKDQMIALLPAKVRGDDIKQHPVWIERGAFFLEEVGFDPSGKDRAVKLNTWKGWKMQPKPGCCERLLELLRYLCSAEANADEVFMWVLRWMAYPLQHPGAKMASAIIMHGPQGTGKSTIWQCLAKIYADYATVLNQRGLEDRFNADWVDSKLFLLAEEVVTRAEMWHIKNELKELITGEWIRVNPKNIAAYRQRNQVNCVFLSNENQPLPLDNDDRRHCVIYTPPALSEEYYDDVFLEIENGGVEALYDYLLNLDLGDFHPKKRPPMTESKQALIALSSPSEIRFMHEWAAGYLGLEICPARSTDVYTVYLRWCRINGEQRPRPSNQFFGAIARLPGWDKRKDRINKETHDGVESIPTPLVIPPERLISSALRYKEGSSRAAWLTRCVEAFSESIRDSLLKVAA